MWRFGLGLALAAALSGCMETTTGAVDDGARTALMATHLNCLRAAAARTDDYKSDALSVAVAILPLCGKEERALREAYSAGMSFDAYQAMMRRVSATNLETATTVVLQGRRGKS